MLGRSQRADEAFAEVSETIAEKTLQSPHSRNSCSPGREHLRRGGAIESKLAVRKFGGGDVKPLAFERPRQPPTDSKIIATFLERLEVEALYRIACLVRSRLVPEQIVDVDETNPGPGFQECAPAGQDGGEIDEVGACEAAPNTIETSGQRELAQVLPLEVEFGGARSGSRKEVGVLVDAGNRDSARSQLGSEVTGTAAKIKHPLTACDGAEGEGTAPLAPGKLAPVLFDE
jgi:hypothetical protein